MQRKHSVSINGHGTSFTVEDAFYSELVRIAAEHQTPLARQVAKIDAAKNRST